jgi:hypothetical protein
MTAYPTERTCPASKSLSAKGQKQTFTANPKSCLRLVTFRGRSVAIIAVWRSVGVVTFSRRSVAISAFRRSVAVVAVRRRSPSVTDVRRGRRTRAAAHSSHRVGGSTHRAPGTHIDGNTVGTPPVHPWRLECLYYLFHIDGGAASAGAVPIQTTPTITALLNNMVRIDLTSLALVHEPIIRPRVSAASSKFGIWSGFCARQTFHALGPWRKISRWADSGN